MSLAELAAANGLRRVGARPRFWQYLKQTWQRRDFIMAMARFRLRASLEGNRLGVLWLLLRPCFNAAIYGAIFGVLQGGNRPPDYVVYVVIGVFLFQFFSASLSDGAKAIVGSQPLVQSLAFPRLTLPLAVVMEQFLSLLPSMGLLLVLLPIFGDMPRWEWLGMIPLLFLYTLFNIGIALFSARLTVHLRDLRQLLPFISRLFFYTSGVLFNVETIFKTHPGIVTLYDFHPIYQVLQIARSLFMGTTTYNPMYWCYLSIWALVAFAGGLVFFWYAEERYGRE